MSNFTFFKNEVAAFRVATGLPIGEGTVNHALHLRLFAEEAFEFVVADDLRSKADALADMIVIACGYEIDAGANAMIHVTEMVAAIECVAWDFGINIVGAFKLVHESNMSKVCKTMEIAKASAEYYEQRHGVSAEIRRIPLAETFYAVYSNSDHKEFPRGKLLKPISYFKPQWHQEDKWLVPNAHAAHSATPEQVKTATDGVKQALDIVDPEGAVARNWGN